MNKQQIKGSVKEAAGKVQEEFGELIDSPSQVAKGLAKQAAGRTEKAVGDVKQAAKNVTK